MGDMQMGLHLCGQPDVAFNNSGFGFRWHATQAEPHGSRSGVHHTSLGLTGILRMLDDRYAQHCCCTKRFAHDAVIQNGFAVIGDGDRTRPLQCLEIGKLLSLAPQGRSGNRQHVYDGAAFRRLHPFGDFHRVVYR